MRDFVKITIITVAIVALGTDVFAQPPEVLTDTLRMPSGLIAHPGDTVCVSVHLINTLAVVSYGLNIPHDTLLEFIDAVPGEAVDSYWVNPSFGYDPFVVDSVIYIISYTQGNPYSTYFPPGDHIIAYIYFYVPEGITDSFSFSLNFEDDTIHEPPRYNVIADTTDFADKMPVKDNGSLLIVSDVEECEGPAETKSPLTVWQEGKETVFRIGSERRAVIELSLFGIDGRLIRRLFKGEVGPGVFVLRRDLGLPRGVYFVKAEVNGKFYTERFVRW